MKIEQSSYRIPPVTSVAKVYNFPNRPQWEQEELTRDMIRAREELRLQGEERAEIAKFNRQMDGVGGVIAKIAVFLLSLLLWVNLCRGWGQ
jgi:hypothetical protein